jgi:hypothetical protein
MALGAIGPHTLARTSDGSATGRQLQPCSEELWAGPAPEFINEERVVITGSCGCSAEELGAHRATARNRDAEPAMTHRDRHDAVEVVAAVSS